MRPRARICGANTNEKAQTMLGVFIGAELQNLLKLFGALVDGSLSRAPGIPAALKSKELVIY